jgi:hypothetical protein
MTRKEKTIFDYVGKSKKELNALSLMLGDMKKSELFFDEMRKELTRRIYRSSAKHDEFKKIKNIKAEDLSDFILESRDWHYQLGMTVSSHVSILLSFLYVINKRLIHIEQELTRQNIIKKEI